MRAAGSPTALENVLVVELGSRVAAGACGSLLAQLGAEVVLVEPAAAAATGKWGHRGQFAAGKRSLRETGPADRSTLCELLNRADVIVASSDADPACLDLLGNAGAGTIVCDITAYGTSSAPLGQAASEWQVQAAAGIVDTTGLSGGAPLPVPFPVVEMMTGGYAATAIVAAVRARSTAAGTGQRIDMALYDCAFVSLATFLPKPLTGDNAPIGRVGNRHPLIAPWNVYRAKDGWVLICVGSDAQWQRLCGLIRCPELRADPRTLTTADRVRAVDFVDGVVQAWVGAQSLDGCVVTLNAADIACGAVATIDGFPREANLDHRGMIRPLVDPMTGQTVAVAGSPLRMSRSPGRHPLTVPAVDGDRQAVQATMRTRRLPQSHSAGAGAQELPLAGIRILEIGHYTTIPLCTRLLASLGAEVIKIEPPEGEATRAWPPTHDGQGVFFSYMNSDKRSLVLDLRRSEDSAVLKALVRGADMLVENLKPGALARRGFSAEALAQLNERLIYCSVSGFGADSLYAGRPAYDSVIQAMSGVMDGLRAEGVPLKTGISCADLAGGQMAVLALVAALLFRDRTGQGQAIDLSMQDIAAWLTQTAWNGAMPHDRAPSVLACRDGHLLVEADGTEVDRLREEVAGLDRTTAARALSARGHAATAVATVPEVAAAPATRNRGLWFTAEAFGERWPLLANPMRLLGTPPHVRRPMPALGADTAAILGMLAEGGAAQ